MASQAESGSGKWQSLQIEALAAQSYLNEYGVDSTELTERKIKVIKELDAAAREQYWKQFVVVYGIHKVTELSKKEQESTLDDSLSIGLDYRLVEGKTEGISKGFSILDLEEGLSAVVDDSPEQEQLYSTVRELVPGRWAVAHVVTPNIETNHVISSSDYSVVSMLTLSVVAPVSSNILFVANSPELLPATERDAEIERMLYCWPDDLRKIKRIMEYEIHNTSNPLAMLVRSTTKFNEILSRLSKQDVTALLEQLESRYTEKLFDVPYILKDALVPALQLGEKDKAWTTLDPRQMYRVTLDGVLMVQAYDEATTTMNRYRLDDLCVRFTFFEEEQRKRMKVAIPLNSLNPDNFLLVSSHEQQTSV